MSKKKVRQQTLNWFVANPDLHQHSITDLCLVAGLSRQALYQHQHRLQQPTDDTTALLEHVKDLRQSHYAAIGCRKLYVVIQNTPNHCHLLSMGRRGFERLLLAHDLGSPLAKPLFRTAKSKKIRFDNLLRDKIIDGTNQVWVSDTTYIWVNQRWHYLTQVVDYYSREILAMHISRSLQAEHTSIAALQQAIAYRDKQDIQACIIHSDGGSQYGDEGFLALVQQYNLVSSMAKIVFENTLCERVNGIFKQEYLAIRPPNNEDQLHTLARYAKMHYNHLRPHTSLKNATPTQFAQKQMLLPPQERITFKAWTLPISNTQTDTTPNDMPSKQ